MAARSRTKTPSTPLQRQREDSVTPPEYKPASSSSKMLTIQSLLNPSTSNNPGVDRSDNHSSSSSSPTPTGVGPSSRRLDTPTTPSSKKGKKAAKDAAVFTKASPTGRVNYLPFEPTEAPICLSEDDRRELARQHKRFRIKPSERAGEGQIQDYTRVIPYSSDKKSFFDKTGKEGFSVYQYTFRVPDDPAQTEYTVMWDYGNGLTRVTPFFKACNHTKTVPAKALTTNPGLKDLAHSITGGALAAQGYWVPYACARAICLTFCYHIRWALTPIFGPSFIRECLPPTHSGYQKFKIGAETVRCATLEAEGWKQAAASTNSPAEIPRSVPQHGTVVKGKELRPRTNRNTMFKDGSPFESDVDAGHESEYAVISPHVSPKTSPVETFDGPTWTSVNSSDRLRAPPSNYSAATSLQTSLLFQPYQCVSWRPADNQVVPKTTLTREPAISEAIKRDTFKRRRSSSKQERFDDDYNDSDTNSDLLSDESDDVDVDTSPKKRRRRTVSKETSAPSSRSTPTGEQSRSCKNKKFTAEDFRAAKLLLSLNKQDDHLAFGPNGLVTK